MKGLIVLVTAMVFAAGTGALYAGDACCGATAPAPAKTTAEQQPGETKVKAGKKEKKKAKKTKKTAKKKVKKTETEEPAVQAVQSDPAGLPAK